MSESSKIRNIARRIRRWAVLQAAKHNFPDDLQGLCAIAARRLFLEFKNEGYSPKIAYQKNHCFVLVDGYLVDVTATQFAHAEVVVRRFTNVKGWYWEVQRTYTTVRGFNSRLRKDRWPHEQSRLKT